MCCTRDRLSGFHLRSQELTGMRMHFRCLMEVLRVPAAGLVRSSMAKDTVRTIAEELVILFNKAVSCAPYMLESSNVKFTMEVTDRVMDTYVQVW